MGVKTGNRGDGSKYIQKDGKFAGSLPSDKAKRGPSTPKVTPQNARRNLAEQLSQQIPKNFEFADQLSPQQKVSPPKTVPTDVDVVKGIAMIKAERNARLEKQTAKGGKKASVLSLFGKITGKATAKTAALTAAVGLAAAGLTGCGTYSQPEPDNVAVCINQGDINNPDDDMRVDDANCGDLTGASSGSGSAFLWYYIGTQMGRNAPYTIPAVGGTVYGGTTTPPPSTSITRSGVSTQGATVKPGESFSSKMGQNGQVIGKGSGYGKPPGTVTSKGGFGGGGAKGGSGGFGG